jgi:hypothetical protein
LAQIYHLEGSLADMPAKHRHKGRQELTKPLWVAFNRRSNSSGAACPTAAASPLRAALNRCQRHRVTAVGDSKMINAWSASERLKAEQRDEESRLTFGAPITP